MRRLAVCVVLNIQAMLPRISRILYDITHLPIKIIIIIICSCGSSGKLQAMMYCALILLSVASLICEGSEARHIFYDYVGKSWKR